MAGDLLTLTMIVKDEVHTLARTLEGAKPYIDRWVILDTGSTDGTQDLVRRVMEGAPGELLEEPFADFSTSRNRALDEAGVATEFVMWLDAGDELVGGRALRAFLEAERWQIGPDREAYHVRVEMAVRPESPRVVRARAGWRFRGAVHEILMHPDRLPPARRVPEALIRRPSGVSSAPRSRRRWERDLVLLTEALAADPRDARSAFYLGETLLRLERFEEAERAFERRIALGGSQEEVYASRMGLARIAAAGGRPWPEIQERFLEAHASAPHRAEALYAIALHYEVLNKHALTFLFARRGYEIPLPLKDRLLVDDEIYTWKLADLVASAGFWIGEHTVGEEAARRACRARPGDARLAQNLASYVERRGKR